MPVETLSQQILRPAQPPPPLPVAKVCFSFVSSLDKQPLQYYLIIMRVPSEAIILGDGH